MTFVSASSCMALLLLAVVSSSCILAQQVPTLGTIPPFTYNESDGTLHVGFRTNVCDRQRMLIDGEIELRNALRGLNLSVAMTNYQGVASNEENFFALDDTTGAIKATDPGLFVVIMDEIARRAGLEWRNSFAAIAPPPPTQSWSDLLKWEVTHYDIAADYWAKSVLRMSEGIAFPHGWYDGSIVMISREETQTDPFDPWSYMVPFEPTVWAAIVVAIFVTGLTYFFLERLNNASDDRYLHDKPWVTIFLAALTFTGHFSFQANTVPSRLVAMSWGFWAIIVVSAYTANMASFLVAQNVVEPRISTIEEALLSSTPLCVQRGSVMDDLLSDKYPDLKLVRKDTEQGMFEGLGLGWYNGKGGCGALLTNLGTYDIYQGQKATNSDCTLGSDKRLILNLPAGFATAVDSAIQCTSLISYVLDVHLQEMQQEGFIQEAWQRHVAKISEVTCGPETNTGGSSSGGGEDANSDGSFSLDMKAMGGIFLNHFVMSVAALGLAFCQRMYTKYNKPERKMRPIKVDEAVHNIVETVDESLKTVAETVDVSMRSMKEGIDGTVRVAKDTMDGSMRHVTRALDESTKNVMQSVDGSMRNMVQTVDGSMRSMTGSMRRVSRPSTRSFRWDASSYDDDANQENSD